MLTGLARDRTFPPGTTLCVEGDPATHVFVLVTGWVKVLSVTSDGHDLVLALRGQGDIVGEVAGETTGQRNATIQAVDQVSALVVSYARFGSFLDGHAQANHAYRRVVTQRWNDAAGQLRSRAVTSGAQRLAGLLLELAGRHGQHEPDGSIHVVMPLSQEELASLAGASRATITRALSNWRGRGFIRTGQRHITIVRPQALRLLAGP